MTFDQLTGKHARLRVQLGVAHAESAWNIGRAGRIERIGNELAEIERALAVQRLGARLVGVDESAAPRALDSRLTVA